jgi:dTDP-4-dehydrorhamnose reductase
MRILVTGCNGQIGYELQRLSEQSEHDWLCLDRAGLDISDQVSVNKVVVDFSPDIVINAAAYTAVDKAESEVDLALAVNARGPEYLAKACQNIDAALIHISTDYVFSGDKTEPYAETDTTGPTGVYGQSKLAGERAVIEHCAKHIILRTAWVFGEHGNNFVKTMRRLGAERDELGIVDDQFGSPTSARGIAEACLNIAEQLDSNPQWGIYHYSGAPYVSWFEFAHEIFEESAAAGRLAKAPKLKALTTEQFPTPAKRPANSKLNCQKIQNVFGISPDDWQTRLSDVIKFEHNQIP